MDSECSSVEEIPVLLLYAEVTEEAVKNDSSFDLQVEIYVLLVVDAGLATHVIYYNLLKKHVAFIFAIIAQTFFINLDNMNLATELQFLQDHEAFCIRNVCFCYFEN